MNSLTQIKLIIFDLDDTLIKSHIDYQKIRKQVVELFDNVPESDYSDTPISILLDNLKEQNLEGYEEALTRVEVLEEEALSKAEIVEWAEKIPLLIEKYNVYSAILTNNTRKGVNKYFEKFPFLKKFFILTRDDVSKMKPDPIGIFKIMSNFISENQKLEKIERKHIVFVGDSFIDAQASHAAGIRFIWYSSRNLSTNNFPMKPFDTITSLTQLESIILKNNFTNGINLTR